MAVIEERKRSSILHVKNIEEEIALIRESEERGGEMPAREVYIEGLEFINNLKL